MQIIWNPQMKKKVNGIIVVEGSNDVSYLSSYIDATYVSLNGFEMKNIEFLKEASKNNVIYLLTDSDNSGETIRSKVKSLIPTCIDVIVDSSKCNKKGKHGVFECEIGEIYRVFSDYFVENSKKECEKNLCKISQIISLSDRPNELRNFICDKLGIESTNNKTFIKRVSLLNIKEEELMDLIKEFNNGN